MEIAAAIEKKFQINPRWLLSGEGSMRVEKEVQYPTVGIPILTTVRAGGENPEFSQIVGGFPRRVTLVNEEEMHCIHQILTVLRTADETTIAAIKGNLVMAVRLSKFLNPRFGDIILIDRRIRHLPRAEWPKGRSVDERKTSS